MDFNFSLATRQDLEGLQYWLNIELAGSVLFLLSFAFYYALYPLAVVALLFLPYMVRILFKEGKFGWILFFILFLVLPGIFYYFRFWGTTYFLTSMFVLIGQFYFYCFLLKLVIPTWLTD